MTTPATLEEVLTTLRAQEAALQKVQATLDRLLQAGNVRGIELRGSLLSTTVVDPARAGYGLSQRDLAERLGLPPSYVSALVRAFKLDEDTACAMEVRSGAKRLVNYHARAVDRFLALLESPPEDLDGRARRVVEQARHRREAPRAA